MHLSCKLTNAVIRSIEDKSEDVSALLNLIAIPEEFLRDPSYWIKVEDFENFLQKFLEIRGDKNPAVLTEVAKSCVPLRSWGVLDSVLRMMKIPGDVFTQPERLLSYFIAPAPPVDQVVRSSDGIAFDLPMSTDHFPLSCEFVRASFEMIPVFMNQPEALCSWTGIRIELKWSRVNKIDSHNEPEDSVPLQRDQPADLEEIRHHVARLSDYMVRAQQVITLISASRGSDKQIKEALRRVDWDLVQTQFPLTVENCFQIFRRNFEGEPHAKNQFDSRS